MKERQCTKCNTLVDVSKAFCPDCGSSMDVEQKREVASEFDLHPETMKMSESGYEMMMQKMELDTSDSPESSEVEKETVHHELPEDPQPAKSKPWLIVAVVVSAFIILLFLLLIAGVFLYMR